MRTESSPGQRSFRTGVSLYTVHVGISVAKAGWDSAGNTVVPPLPAVSRLSSIITVFGVVRSFNSHQYKRLYVIEMIVQNSHASHVTCDM